MSNDFTHSSFDRQGDSLVYGQLTIVLHRQFGLFALTLCCARFPSVSESSFGWGFCCGGDSTKKRHGHRRTLLGGHGRRHRCRPYRDQPRTSHKEGCHQGYRHHRSYVQGMVGGQSCGSIFSFFTGGRGQRRSCGVYSGHRGYCVCGCILDHFRLLHPPLQILEKHQRLQGRQHG